MRNNIHTLGAHRRSSFLSQKQKIQFNNVNNIISIHKVKNQQFQNFKSSKQCRPYTSWTSLKSPQHYREEITKHFNFDIVDLGEYKNRGIVTQKPVAKDEIVLRETPFIAVCNKCVQGDMSCGYCQAKHYYEPMTHEKLLVHPKEAASPINPENMIEPFMQANAESMDKRRKNVELYCQKTGERFPLMVKKLVAKVMQSFIETGNGNSAMLHLENLSCPKLGDVSHEWKVHYHLLCQDLFQGDMEENKEYFNEDWYKKIMGILHLNSFELELSTSRKFNENLKDKQLKENDKSSKQNFSHDEHEAMMLFILGSYFNHSCVPNIGVRSAGKEDKHPMATEFIALRDIDAGEELSVSYVDLNQPVEKREHQLQFAYGFTCYDEKCTDCKTKKSAQPQEQ